MRKLTELEKDQAERMDRIMCLLGVPDWFIWIVPAWAAPKALWWYLRLRYGRASADYRLDLLIRCSKTIAEQYR